jgi:hypothetical protein
MEITPTKEAPIAAAAKITVGDPGIDAILNDTAVPESLKNQLLDNFERRIKAEKAHAAQNKQIQDLQSKAAIADKTIEDYRKSYLETNHEFQKMMLGKAHAAQATAELERKVNSGEMDSHIMSQAGKNEIAANKRAIVALTQRQELGSEVSGALKARARKLHEMTSQPDMFPGAAVSFGSSSTGMVAAAKVPLYPSSLVLNEDEMDQRDDGVISAAKPQFAPSVMVQAQKRSYPMLPDWNTQVNIAFNHSLIGRDTAQSLVAPKIAELAKEHPVVISAAKGYIGARPKATAKSARGTDAGWCPELGPDTFHPDTLSLLIGDGGEVPDKFNLIYNPNVAPDGYFMSTVPSSEMDPYGGSRKKTKVY